MIPEQFHDHPIIGAIVAGSILAILAYGLWRLRQERLAIERQAADRETRIQLTDAYEDMATVGTRALLDPDPDPDPPDPDPDPVAGFDDRWVGDTLDRSRIAADLPALWDEGDAVLREVTTSRELVFRSPLVAAPWHPVWDIAPASELADLHRRIADLEAENAELHRELGMIARRQFGPVDWDELAAVLDELAPGPADRETRA